ncbi:MAG: hypothetical protein NC548_43085 [Lachnospiraceae bacterium]|nr:hypothetical protein [Lachnospiraceae bacterium]
MSNSSYNYSRRNCMERQQLDWWELEQLERMQGWGYQPKLNPAAKTAFRKRIYWHRVRSFCVRSPYG